MSNAADSPHAASESLLGQVEDFGQSALHTALESPVNGVIQIIDHAANAHLPELNIIGAPKNDSIGAKAGAVVGAAADIVAISIATGGVADLLGAGGAAATVATAAATGAIYGGILTPSDANSKHFVTDRLTNGTIGAATFATMAGAAQLLGATGLFAVPAARTLGASVTLGGLAGAAGGVANAEATAVLKEGKALPSGSELASSVATQALFGAAYGGLSYGFNQVAGPASRPTVVNSEGRSITTVNDENGQPVSFKAVVPSLDNPDTTDIIINSSKSMTGTWNTAAKAVWRSDGSWGGEAYVPQVDSATTADDGTVTVAEKDGSTRSFTPGGKYVRGPSTEETETAARQAAYQLSLTTFDRTATNGDHEVASPGNGYQRYDSQGNTIAFSDGVYSNNGAEIKPGPNGTIDEVSLKSNSGQPYVNIQRTAGDTWKFSNGDNVYSWNGDIQPVKDPATNQVTGLTFTPQSGTAVKFDLQSGTQQVANTLLSTGKFESLQPSLGYVRAGENGQAVMKAGSYQKLFVNGQQVTGETTVTPGDKINLQVDVGDRYAEWQDRPVNLFTAEDGATMVDSTVVGEKPLNLAKVTTAQAK